MNVIVQKVKILNHLLGLVVVIPGMGDVFGLGGTRRAPLVAERK